MNTLNYLDTSAWTFHLVRSHNGHAQQPGSPSWNSWNIPWCSWKYTSKCATYFEPY